MGTGRAPLALPLLLWALAGCARNAGSPGEGADGSCPPRVCVAENGEDCAGCFERLGQCCYGDTDWKSYPGARDDLAKACLGSPGCGACCNECKALSCDQMKAQHLCPNLPP